jgi:hypothetical protein
MGSARLALRAGAQLATAATPAKSTVTVAMVNGSVPLT